MTQGRKPYSWLRPGEPDKCKKKRYNTETPRISCKQRVGLHEDVQQHQVRGVKNVALDEDVFIVEVPEHMTALAAVSRNRADLFCHLECSLDSLLGCVA